MAAAVRESLVPVPGGYVFVRQWDPGRSERAPILLLHDSLGSVEQWRDFPAALATTAGRTVAAYDRLGFGLSSPRTDAPSFRFIEEEAEVFFPAVARGLGFERYVLFGHSVGGAMALTIASCGHVPHREKEGEVLRLVRTFIDEQAIP